VHGAARRRRSCGSRRSRSRSDAARARRAPSGWHAGDRLVLPDTRQLGGDERGSRYHRGGRSSRWPPSRARPSR
jgi:hypothetical protein